MKNIAKKNIQMNSLIPNFEIINDLNKIGMILGISIPKKIKGKIAHTDDTNSLKYFDLYRPILRCIIQPSSKYPPKESRVRAIMPYTKAQISINTKSQTLYHRLSVFDAKTNMILCPSGNYSKTQSDITTNFHISKPFFMSETEITLDMYFSVMQQTKVPDEYKDYPMIISHWTDVCEFCNRLSDLFGLDRVYSVEPIYIHDVDKKYEFDSNKTHLVLRNFRKIHIYTRNVNANGFRVPTEAEWEYAAYAGTQNRYAGGNSPYLVGNIPKKGEYANPISPVKKFKPNEWGFYDMTGNVWEWCEDLPVQKNDKIWNKVPTITDTDPITKQKTTYYLDPYFPIEVFEFENSRIESKDPNTKTLYEVWDAKSIKGGDVKTSKDDADISKGPYVAHLKNSRSANYLIPPKFDVEDVIESLTTRSYNLRDLFGIRLVRYAE
jgi:hypothetical protein